MSVSRFYGFLVYSASYSTTGTNSFIINLFIIKDSLSYRSISPTFSLFAIMSHTTPRPDSFKKGDHLVCTQFTCVFFDPNFILKQPNIHHALNMMNSDSCRLCEQANYSLYLFRIHKWFIIYNLVPLFRLDSAIVKS